MRTILNGRCRALLAGAALLTTAFGCDNADLGAIDNAAYIAEAQKETSSTVEVGNDGATASLTARLGGKADGEYSFRIEADPEVLERFNALNGTSYTLLPETGYEIPGDPLVIGTGDVAATPVAIKILPYTQEMDDSGQTYALPVTLRSLDGRMTVLDDASQFLIVCNRKKIVPAPVFNSEYATGGVTKRNRVILNMKDAPITFTAYTFEFMMYKEAFDYRNYMIVGFDNEDGLGNRMWVRFEASSTTADQENRWRRRNGSTWRSSSTVHRRSSTSTVRWWPTRPRPRPRSPSATSRSCRSRRTAPRRSRSAKPVCGTRCAPRPSSRTT